jgi:hypothetical protein
MYVLYVKSQSLEVSKIKNNKKNFEKFLFIFIFETSGDWLNPINLIIPINVNIVIFM